MQRYSLKGGKSVSQVFLLEAIAVSVLGATLFLTHFLTDAPVQGTRSYSTLAVNGGNPRLRVLPVYMKFTHPWCEAFLGGAFLLPAAWNIPERNLHWMCDASLAAYRHLRHCRGEGQRGTGLIPRVHTQWRMNQLIHCSSLFPVDFTTESK